MINYRAKNYEFRSQQGITLIELLIVVGLFGIIMAGLYSAYNVQVKQSMIEYKLSQTEMEFQIGKNVIERDLAMAGFGMADDYSGLGFEPKVLQATDGTPDGLLLRGTAIGRGTRASQAWSYVSSSPTLTAGPDSRENLQTGDRIIYIEPNVKKLLTSSTGSNSLTDRMWLFPSPAAGDNPNPDPLENGVVAYGLQTEPDNIIKHADFPYYEVEYFKSTTSLPSYCAAGTWNLLRSENRKSSHDDAGQPLFNCVADFQVALGIDNTEDGLIDCWDNGGYDSSGYLNKVFRKRLKQIRVYILLQQGNRDPAYLYMGTGTGSNKVTVGDWNLNKCSSGAAAPGLVGHEPELTSEQRKYRWKVLKMSIAPRNIRE